MAVRSDRLGGPLVLAPLAAGTLFVVPAGETWLVKRVTSYNSGPLATVAYWIYDAPGGSPSAGVHVVSLQALRADDHETWWACDPGSILRVANDAGGGLQAVAFGAKLLGAA